MAIGRRISPARALGCQSVAVWRFGFGPLAPKENLMIEGAKIGLEMYKFVGDGWILLGPHNIDRNGLFDFLHSFFCFLDIALHEESVNELLARRPKPMGLTLGIDSGDLIKLEMNEQVEYVGRALNVASRLQSAAKQFCQDYGATALISKSAYAQMRGEPDPDIVRLQPATVPLKHISGSMEFTAS